MTARVFRVDPRALAERDDAFIKSFQTNKRSTKIVSSMIVVRIQHEPLLQILGCAGKLLQVSICKSSLVGRYRVLWTQIKNTSIFSDGSRKLVLLEVILSHQEVNGDVCLFDFQSFCELLN